MSEVKTKVIDIIAEQLGVDKSEIKDDSNITDDLAADSLDVVELIMALEEEFGGEIPDEAAEKLTTPADIVAYIENRSSEGSSNSGESA